MPHVACDLEDPRATAAAVLHLAPAAVIHAQALSDVDRCEQEPARAEALNAAATRHLVDALAGTPAWLVYVSSDYVFDGAKGAPYDEADAPRPLSVYGRSKLAGEAAALRHPRTLVVRPSTLFGPGRMNFCDFIVQQLLGGGIVEAFCDQTTSPTYTVDLAEALVDLLGAIRQTSSMLSRVVHVANAGACTREAFAEYVADRLGHPRAGIRAIRMADQRRPARRPPCSALTSRYLKPLIGRELRPWDEAVTAYLRRRRWLA